MVTEKTEPVTNNTCTIEFICPFCGFTPKRETKKMRAMRNHFRLQHKCVPDSKGVLHPMGPSIRTSNLQRVRSLSTGNAVFVSGGLPGFGKRR